MQEIMKKYSIDLRTTYWKDYLMSCAEKVTELIERDDVEIVVDYEYALVHYKMSLDELEYSFPKSKDSLRTVFEELDEDISELHGSHNRVYGRGYDCYTEEELLNFFGFNYDYIDKRGRHDYQAEIEEGKRYYAWKEEREKRNGYYIKDNYLFVPARGEGIQYMP